MLLATIAAVDDEEERCRLTATGLPAVVRCSLSGVGFRSECGEEWRFALYRGEQLLSVPAHSASLSELKRLAENALDQRSMLVVQTSDDDAPAAALSQLGIRTLAVFALRTVGTQLGALFVGRDSEDQLDEAEDTVLRTVAQQLTISCENARLRGALQKHVDELEDLVSERTLQLQRSEARQRALLELNNSIVTELDRAALFEAVAQVLASVVPFDRASLAEYDSTTDTFQVGALARTPTAATVVGQGTRFLCKGSHLQDVLDEKRPRIRSDLEQGARTTEEDALLAEGLRSYVAVPLIAKGDAIGTLNVASAEPGCYSNDDATFLTEVASQVALAIDNMQAYEEITALKARLQEENLYLREEVETERQSTDIVGTSQPIRAVLAAINQVAATDATVLLNGETGTGKELVARAVHAASERKARTMVTVNCAALPAGLLESELFGHERGAFTGALSRKTGRFELADKSTLFLDEIGDLPLELQAKLLRALQEGTFERVGGSGTIGIDVRVIAATNRDLEKAVGDRTFREDLYYRLNVFPISVPPLRDRREDIPQLVKHFVMRYAREMRKTIDSIPKRTIDAMTLYAWPGNVRELQNVIQRAVILCKGTRLDVGDWLPQRAARSDGADMLSLDEVQRRHITEVLEMTGWRVSGERGAAKVLGLKPTTLDARMKKLGIVRPT